MYAQTAAQHKLRIYFVRMQNQMRLKVGKKEAQQHIQSKETTVLALSKFVCVHGVGMEKLKTIEFPGLFILITDMDGIFSLKKK